MQDWLYDEGEDETKSVYTQKLEELLRLGSPIEQREREAHLRPPAAQALTAAAQHYMGLATDPSPKFSHISQEDKDKVGPSPLASFEPYFEGPKFVCLCQGLGFRVCRR